MKIIPVEAREWLPDQPDLNNPGLTLAKNVFPTPGGYGPVREIDFSPDVASLSQDTGIPDTEFVVECFAKLSSKRYVISSGHSVKYFNASNSVQDVTPASGFEINTKFDFTAFAVYGDDVYINSASLTGGGLYKFVDGSAGTFVSGSPGSPVMARVGNFLMTASVTTLTWSAFNDPDTWTITPGNQAGSAQVANPEYGIVTKITGGRTPLIFQEYGISRLEYVGPPLIWRTTPISAGYGARAIGSAVVANDITYFMDHGGPCATDGSSVVRLGDNVVNRWVEENTVAIPVRTIHWREGRKIIWEPNAGYKAGGSATPNNKFLVYDYSLDQFSYFEYTGLTLFHDGDTPRVSNENRPLYGVGAYTGSFFTGPLTEQTLAAEIETGHLAAQPGHRTAVRGAEPLYTGSGATCAVSTKETVNGAATVSNYTAQNAQGFCDLNGSGRYVGIKTNIAPASEWSDFSGWNVDAEVTGEN